VIPDEKDEKLILQAVAIGEFSVSATLETKYGKYRDSAPVTVDYSFGRPTRNNFSGRWQISLGHRLGEMETDRTPRFSFGNI
jgi:hypothetical protein